MMVDVAIVVDGVTFTFDNGEVNSCNSGMSANLDHDSMPGSAPKSSLLFDFNGGVKTIEISGQLYETATTRTSTGTTKTIDAQRQWLEQRLNGSQSSITFTSNYGSSYDGSSFVSSTVYIASIRWTETTGFPLELFFTITFFVGDV